MSQPQLASIDEDGWMIDDGEVAHSESPETYWIPSLAERQSLEVDDFAKIRFYIRVTDSNGETEDCGERMWVKVVGRTGDWYHGELANQPSCTDEMNPGLEVWFQARHVINIKHPDRDQVSAP